MNDLRLTPKQSLMIEKNKAIQELIEKFDCQLIPDKSVTTAAKIEDRINTIFSEFYNKQNNDKIQLS
jgi:hypothetical protein